MLGLTFDKLLLIAVIAGVLLGPHRLPAYAQKLGQTVRDLRAFADSARVKAESELGISIPASTLQSLDIRQYDPRRIVRDAFSTPADAGLSSASNGADAENPPPEGTSESQSRHPAHTPTARSDDNTEATQHETRAIAGT